jgi:sec-independent protein translocase protein TatA
MLGRFGVAELLIIALLLILFFGGKKIPELIKGVGDAIREFRKGAKEE